MLKKLVLAAALLGLFASPALADSYETVPHPTAVWDTTTGTAYALGLPGKGQTGLTVLPSLGAANNFTGTFQIGGVTQHFPASGNLVGTTDTQTLSGKTLSTLTIGSSTLAATTVTLTNGAAAASGTLTNAPAAGNPTKWIPINDNGTTRYIPAW